MALRHWKHNTAKTGTRSHFAWISRSSSSVRSSECERRTKAWGLMSRHSSSELFILQNCTSVSLSSKNFGTWPQLQSEQPRESMSTSNTCAQLIECHLAESCLSGGAGV